MSLKIQSNLHSMVEYDRAQYNQNRAKAMLDGDRHLCVSRSWSLL
jgi:hypothetical protein